VTNHTNVQFEAEEPTFQAKNKTPTPIVSSYCWMRGFVSCHCRAMGWAILACGLKFGRLFSSVRFTAFGLPRRSSTHIPPIRISLGLN